MNLVIRSATHRDIPALYELSCRVHLSDMYKTFISDAYRDKYIKRYTYDDGFLQSTYIPRVAKRLDDMRWRIKVACVKEKIVGFVASYHEGDAMQLRELFVDTNARRGGVGGALIDALTADAQQRIEVIVVAANSGAIDFYKQRGFLVTSATDKLFYGAKQIVMGNY